MGREQHPRRADPALRRAVLDECLLQSRQTAVFQSQPFHCHDILTFDLAYSHQAAIDYCAVDEDRAGAALALAAAFFRACRAQILPQDVEQPTRTRSFA